jgi:hypothetical protein
MARNNRHKNTNTDGVGFVRLSFEVSTPLTSGLYACFEFVSNFQFEFLAQCVVKVVIVV